MTAHFDVAVVGGGIVGLAHAWMAARRGLRAAVFERSEAAEGASVRNFGMVWPVGQPAGELHGLALRSRELWLELHAIGVVSVEQCGSIHLAHRQDELSIQEEFCQQETHDVRMLSAGEVADRSALAKTEGLLAGMFSPAELRIDPRTACARIASWLTESHGVECFFRSSIVAVENHGVRASDGRCCHADRIIVCSGSDLQTLYPEMLARSGLVLCKLQMLKSVAQPHPARTAPHLASGLTLRHYAAFWDCPSWNQLLARVERENPELNRFGIHVMVSSFPNGEVVLGDSHEYGDEITPFDKTEIDELILREARRVFRLTDWTMTQRWHGIYSKHPQLPAFESALGDGVHIFVGTGARG